MIQLLEEVRDDLVAFRISGSVDRHDYDVMFPLLQERIRQHGKIRVYAEVHEVADESLRALWEDIEIEIDMEHASDFSKVAVVGEEKWIDWINVMVRPFTTAEVKYFDFSQVQPAWEWVNT